MRKWLNINTFGALEALLSEFAGFGDTGRYTPIRLFAGIMAGVTTDDQDRRVAALLDDGVSYRQVAALLGMSLGAVQRAARRARGLLPASRAAVADPIVELLTFADMAHLRVSARGELSMLDRYRMLGLPEGSAAGDAARALFDHGRGGEALDRWMRVVSQAAGRR
jgi:hypothetical protein